uniref:DUF1449 domain-containing protein n=1 Tax=uncultured Thiotrichaceae bacterium TaxID=298394 RepID=A0A6S6UG73_9GAMM|nr:MAG: Unknown protein [uncultured Thiotrichaceae bacterium]
MEAFILNIFTFPTIFYSGLLVLVILYWFSAVAGIVDIDSADADIDADTSTNALGSWLSKFKLDGIPLTITLSLIVLFSWVLCFLAVHFFYPLLPETWVQIMMGAWALVISPVIAALMVSPLVQPLKPLFKKQQVTSNTDLVGHYAIVRSGKVTATFGEAEFQDGGAGLIIKIRADEPNQIRRDDQVALLSYDAASSTYQVRGSK